MIERGNLTSGYKLPALLLVLFLTITSCSFSPGGNHGGDLPEIESSGKLKVIVRPREYNILSGPVLVEKMDREIAEGLARELGLKLKYIETHDEEEMIRRLTAGEGDIIAADMAVTGAREKRVDFTTAYLHTDELLVTRRSEPVPAGFEGLEGKRICVEKGSSYALTLERLRRKYHLNIVYLPDAAGPGGLLDMVSTGECFATAVDSKYWDDASVGYADLTAPLVLTRSRPMALAVRKGAVLLKRRINEFLISGALSARPASYTGDLDAIRKRGVLRVITRNNATTYYIYRGEQVGFDYDLLKRFAEGLHLRLKIVIAPDHRKLIKWLNEGRGDMIAAAMTITGKRKKKVEFTTPYQFVDEVVVVRDDYDRIKTLKDLGGKMIYVRKSSSFYDTLMTLKKKIRGLAVGQLPEDMETEDILAGVEEGKWDVTMSDSNLLQIEQNNGRRLTAALKIKKTGLGWAVREDDIKLLAALNRFIEKEYRGLYYNTLKKKYFERRVSKAVLKKGFRSDVSGKISPYDEVIRKYSDRYGLDWRLVTAQMYQESKFNPRKVSWAGAGGLMQLMPRTARALGIKNYRSPEASIKGGTLYLKRLINKFGSTVPLRERIRFALAAYNAGYNHVSDARRLAARLGYNPDIWDGNVEKAMALLQRPAYFKKARYGYCRGRGTVKYVREILDRYSAYVRHVPEA